MLKETLELFAMRVKKQALSNLTKSKKSNTKELYNSIKTEVKVSKNSFQLTISMADYGIFVDQGVKGKSSSTKAPNSPFKFGTGTGKKGGLTDGVLKWVRSKRIQFKDTKTGKFISYKSTSFLMAKAIYNKGIRPTNFITKPFENEFKKLPKELVEAYGLELKSLIKTTFQK